MRFAEVCQVLHNEQLSLLVAWELLRSLLPLTYSNVATYYEAESLNQMCMKAVARAMEVPLLSWYLFKEVSPGTLVKATEMANYVRKTIMSEIESATWLDSSTRKMAITKLYYMQIHVGYPKYFATPKEMERFYHTYPDIENSFLQPWKEAMQKTVIWMTTNSSSFWFSVASTNAIYLPMRNHIVIPATVLRMPLFSMAAPMSLVYGGLGAVLGHEMTHAFDPVGSRWDAQGRERDWWTASSRQLYNNRIICLRHSHGTAQADTDAENTADFAGLVSSYVAYSNLEDTQMLEGLPYDAEQLFFISSCIKWCASAGADYSKRYAPWWERCNVPPKNMDEFADAFHCAVGSDMRPAQRCTFW
ncbi:endothelin-converting enzyme homolog [Rhipicephalus microplus]|uniref:endothelin-converting enzyme homolog n=1 Tax=Rhipicephalus microplus TaxID=6941 RepID=UPI003F6AF481